MTCRTVHESVILFEVPVWKNTGKYEEDQIDSNVIDTFAKIFCILPDRNHTYQTHFASVLQRLMVFLEHSRAFEGKYYLKP